MFRLGPKFEFGDGGKKTLFSTGLAVLIGVGLVALGFSTFQSQNQALENPVNVTATVFETGIQEDSSRRGGIDYQPQVTFEYSYEGEEYTSGNMYPGGQKPEKYDSESEARKVIEGYSQGSEIEVSVPPDNPGEAFIRVERTDRPLFFMGIGLLFILLGSYQFVKSYYM